MTDDERLRDPLAAARALPRGSIVVLRARERRRRESLVLSLAKIVRQRGLVLLVADDPMLARGADGLHLPQARMHEAPHWRARLRGKLITTSAHSLASLMRAEAFHADAVFLAPMFSTASHPNTVLLTPIRARFMARQARIPIYALGGIDAQNASALNGGPFAGIAAIKALSV